MLTIENIREKITPICKSYGVERLYLFGSYARGSFNENSDIDFRIDKGRIRGIQLGGLYMDLQDTFQNKVDLLTTNQLSEDFLNSIRNEEILLYWFMPTRK